MAILILAMQNSATIILAIKATRVYTRAKFSKSELARDSSSRDGVVLQFSQATTF